MVDELGLSLQEKATVQTHTHTYTHTTEGKKVQNKPLILNFHATVNPILNYKHNYASCTEGHQKSLLH